MLCSTVTRMYSKERGTVPHFYPFDLMTCLLSSSDGLWVHFLIRVHLNADTKWEAPTVGVLKIRRHVVSRWRRQWVYFLASCCVTGNNSALSLPLYAYVYHLLDYNTDSNEAAKQKLNSGFGVILSLWALKSSYFFCNWWRVDLTLERFELAFDCVAPFVSYHKLELTKPRGTVAFHLRML